MWESCCQDHTSTLGCQTVGVVNSYFSTALAKEIYRLLKIPYLLSDGPLERSALSEQVESKLREIDTKEKWMSFLTQLLNSAETGAAVCNARIAKDGTAKLKAFTDWLQSARCDLALVELPGQYTGDLQPQPETHLRISSCGPKLLVMNSKQKPKRLTIFASNENEYHFLVKGGEDLRLDQRIQQILRALNELLGPMELNIRTFGVTPMSPFHGMFEWVCDSIPYKCVVEEALTRRHMIAAPTERTVDGFVTPPPVAKREKGGRVSLNECAAMNQFTSFLRALNPHSKSPEETWKAVFQASEEVVIKNFQECVKQMGRGVLKTTLWRWALNPEAFWLLKNNLIKTLAAFNAAGYVLGIGDRHPENFLMDTENAEVIGIDFGYAFDVGVTMLPIPELVPFRLSPLLLEVCEPFGGEEGLGLYQSTTEKTLRVIRENASLLETVCSLFVNEPLMDWTKEAMAKANGQFYFSGEQLGCVACEEKSNDHHCCHHGERTKRIEDICKQKLKTVQMKITGVHPSEILRLQLENHVQPYVRELISSSSSSSSCTFGGCIDGSSTGRFRSRVVGVCPPSSSSCGGHAVLSISVQTKCLVDLAIDCNVVGRAWRGWLSFV